MKGRDDELDKDIREHLEFEIEDNVARGMTHEEARYAALRKFGNIAHAKEQTRAVWTWAWLESVQQDVRYAFRSFAKTPIFVLAVVGTIGLALGLNTTLFTIFNAYVLRPLAVRDPYSLYRVYWSPGTSFSPTEYDDLAQTSGPFSEILATSLFATHAAGFQIVGEQVSGNYFRMLAAGVEEGRPLLPGDTNAIVISDVAWKNKFGSSRNILGTRVQLLGGSYEIVGVARSEFSGMSQVIVDLWIPLIRSGPIAPQQFFVIGRLAPAVTLNQARSALQVWSQRESVRHPGVDRRRTVALESAATSIHITWQIMAVFSPLLTAFALVLVIACANVTNMMLARGMARQREIGVRLSLGAGRGRLIRQLLIEGLLLALPAALAGLVISQVTLRLCERLMFATAPAVYLEVIHFFRLQTDFRVFFFVLTAAGLATLVLGLAPAIQATRPGLYQATRGDFTADVRPARLRNALVAVQATVCVLLLISSVILLRSTNHMDESDVRMDARHVLQLRFSGRQIDPKVADRLAHESGVEIVATAWRAPLSGRPWSIPMAPDGQKDFTPSGFNFVSPSYFNLFRIPILKGRNFSSDESLAEASLTIVSQKTAEHFWPGANPIGQVIRISPEAKGSQWLKVPAFHSAVVVGVVQDVMSGGPAAGIDTSCFYFPTSPSGPQNDALLVRTRGDFGMVRRQLDDAVAQVSKDAISFLIPTEQAIALDIYPFRVASWIGSALGCLALVLTVSGLYGVLSYFVSQRTKEIGIRMALGSSAAGVVRIVVALSMKLASIGIVIGTVLALGVSMIFASTFEEIKVFDLVAYFLGIAAAAGSALAAAYFPARRAAAVDPMTALRCD